MSQDNQGWFASRTARLSTGLKMLLILSLGLLPLGLIAILASLQSARENAAERTDRTEARLAIKGQRINTLLTRSSGTIRAASAAVSFASDDSGVCEQTLGRLTRAQTAAGRYALFGASNRLRCATPGYAPSPLANPQRVRSRIEVSKDGETLRFALFQDSGAIEGMGEFSRETLSDLTYIKGTDSDFDLALSQGSRTMTLRNGYSEGPLAQTVTAIAPVADGRLQLRMTLNATPVSATEILMILLPVLMWIFAGGIGWLIVNRLLLRPLVRMQKAVAAYRPGDRHLNLPFLTTPAREIGELGSAFDQVTQTVARHEADLEAAIERQTKLVREVHHRVKNNLQVVASLLNLHARGATSEDVAAAYASIQRRVDALSVVHRNHFAELEENRGVALRSLISELGANLRATAPPSAAHMAIRLDVEPYYVTQDVAVSVAFLLTEIAEYAMFCGGHGVSISLIGDGGPTARLAIGSDALKAGIDCEERLSERFERIVTGLSRQLRSTLDRDLETGCYALPIAVIDKAER